MYVWIGIDVDSQLENIREKARQIEQNIGFKNSNFTLPLHVSLKISFFIEDNIFESVKADIINIFNDFNAFDISVKGVELDEMICWIMMKENAKLNAIHDKLNSVMLEKYNVPLHEYDGDYKFHTTLFMDNDISKVKAAFESLGDIYIPDRLIADKFVVGTSDSGALGTYKVVYEHKKQRS